MGCLGIVVGVGVEDEREREKGVYVLGGEG